MRVSLRNVSHWNKRTLLLNWGTIIVPQPCMSKRDLKLKLNSYKCTWILNLDDRAKHGLCFDLSVQNFFCVCVCLLCVCVLSHDYGHMHLQIVMKFGIYILCTKSKQCICKKFVFFHLSKWLPLCEFFHSYGRQARSDVNEEILVNTDHT